MMTGGTPMTQETTTCSFLELRSADLALDTLKVHRQAADGAGKSPGWDTSVVELGNFPALIHEGEWKNIQQTGWWLVHPSEK